MRPQARAHCAATEWTIRSNCSLSFLRVTVAQARDIKATRMGEVGIGGRMRIRFSDLKALRAALKEIGVEKRPPLSSRKAAAMIPGCIASGGFLSHWMGTQRR